MQPTFVPRSGLIIFLIMNYFSYSIFGVWMSILHKKTIATIWWWLKTKSYRIHFMLTLTHIHSIWRRLPLLPSLWWKRFNAFAHIKNLLKTEFTHKFFSFRRCTTARSGSWARRAGWAAPCRPVTRPRPSPGRAASRPRARSRRSWRGRGRGSRRRWGRCRRGGRSSTRRRGRRTTWTTSARRRSGRTRAPPRWPLLHVTCRYPDLGHKYTHSAQPAASCESNSFTTCWPFLISAVQLITTTADHIMSLVPSLPTVLTSVCCRCTPRRCSRSSTSSCSGTWWSPARSSCTWRAARAPRRGGRGARVTRTWRWRRRRRWWCGTPSTRAGPRTPTSSTPSWPVSCPSVEWRLTQFGHFGKPPLQLSTKRWPKY